MAHTEDIPEKVMQILLEQVAKYLNLGGDVVVQGGQAVGAVTSSFAYSVFDKLKENADLREYLKVEGEIPFSKMSQLINKFGERSRTISYANSDAKEYEALLKEQGVGYAKMDRTADDVTMFVFLNKDSQKVHNASVILDSRRGKISEVQPDLYFNSMSPDKVFAFEGLSNVELELFRHYAREEQILFTAIPKNDKYMIVSGHEDAQKMRRAMLRTGWALTGANGARVREQVQYRLAGRSSIRIAAEEANRELFIVSGNRPDTYVHITHNDYAFYKDNKQVKTVDRSDPDFLRKCMAECDGLPHPVLLTPEQKRNITPQELSTARTVELFPSSYEDVVQIHELNSFVNLVMLKEGLDNEGNATWGLWDPSVSYSEFASYEYIQDSEELEAREREFEHFKKAAYYTEDNLIEHSVEMDQKSVDYIIAQAEAKRKAMANNNPERDKGSKEQSMQSRFNSKVSRFF